MAKRILIYGATGYTGKLVAREAARRELDVVLAGRDPLKLKEVASVHGFEARALTLDDGSRLRAALEDIGAVLHIAGPFSKTSRPMADACNPADIRSARDSAIVAAATLKANTTPALASAHVQRRPDLMTFVGAAMATPWVVRWCSLAD